jgi:hypothetical protein
MNKPLARLRKRQRRLRYIKSETEMGNITTDIIEMQRIIRDYAEQPHTNKFDSLEEIREFLDTCTLQRLTHEERENLSRPITRNKIESVI